MKIIYEKDKVSIQSVLGEITGNSLLHYYVAKCLLISFDGHNTKETQEGKQRIIFFETDIEKKAKDLGI